MKVCIIGGGASGMAAALSAAESGHHVLLLERQARVGRKLLSTGNGRCNLTNLHASPAHYHGRQPEFCRSALERFPVRDTLAFFASLGLVTTAEDSGRVYPYSNMAGSVLDVLRFALEQPNIDLRTAQVVTSVKRRADGFTIRTESDTFTADRVILAAGGCAGSKLGGVMDGYQIAKSLGHHRTALYPSLVQIKTDSPYPRSLKGIKADAQIRVMRGDTVLAENQGEVLFTEYGISGPAVFEISRAVSTGGDGLRLVLDFWSDASDTMAWLRQRQAASGNRAGGTLLTGIVHTRLGQMLCKSAGITNQPANTLTDAHLNAIWLALRSFTLPVLGVCGFDQAQVTAGGLRTDEFDPDTLQSRIMPGFYACGEVLDIDGDCGGFNLQWAWSSGRLAGKLN
ncbi:MAG: aminoacetone oxidase family FAD-binding enzyme [Clostridiales bacterium]|nr:aminoacetone oxidase family FAD-binding enzyme [Candidatus Cacconaster stercorequi]